MLEKLFLQRMQLVAMGHALDGLHRFTLDLGSQHEAGTHQPIVDQDAARAAVARTATFFGAGEREFVTQDVEQSHLGVTEKLVLISIDGGSYVLLCHFWFNLWRVRAQYWRRE